MQQVTIDAHTAVVAPWTEATPGPEPEGVPAPVAFVFPSRTDGPPHVVSVADTGILMCTCAAMRSIESRPAGCWAMKEARRMLGREAP